MNTDRQRLPCNIKVAYFNSVYSCAQEKNDTVIQFVENSHGESCVGETCS